MRYVLPLAISTMLLAGCASIAPASTPTASTRHVIDRNYEIGVERSAYVGQPVVRVKDYWVTTSTFSAFRASAPFTIRDPIFGEVARGDATTPIPVVGTTTRDGATYYLARPQGVIGLLFLVNQNGKFEGTAQNGAARMGKTYRIDPPDVTLQSTSADLVDSTRGFQNYELLYSGTSRDGIKFLYREYTQQDLARPAYSQELTYQKNTPTIRYRDTQIRIISADNEAIRYAVIADGAQ